MLIADIMQIGYKRKSSYCNNCDIRQLCESKSKIQKISQVFPIKNFKIKQQIKNRKKSRKEKI